MVYTINPALLQLRLLHATAGVTGGGEEVQLAMVLYFYYCYIHKKAIENGPFGIGTSINISLEDVPLLQRYKRNYCYCRRRRYSHHRPTEMKSVPVLGTYIIYHIIIQLSR